MCDEEIIQMIGEFCDECLDDEFKDLSVRLAYRLADTEGVSFDSDKAENWACGIIYAVGQLNFLFERVFEPYIDRDELCYYFSTKRTKINNKARDIRRLLDLKLGNEEFSTEFVLSLRIPESDEDLKRIRQFDEVKFQINRRPDGMENLNNEELEAAINRIRFGDGWQDDMDELYRMLRKAYFIYPQAVNGNLVIAAEGSKYRVPVFTGMDKCRSIRNEFGFKLKLWPFVNILYLIRSEDFDGVVVNPDGDEFLITRDMISRVYPNPDKFDYWQIFFLR